MLLRDASETGVSNLDEVVKAQSSLVIFSGPHQFTANWEVEPKRLSREHFSQVTLSFNVIHHQLRIQPAG